MPHPRVGGIKRSCTSDVCLPRTLGLSQEQRALGRLKLTQEVAADIICDSDTTFKAKRSKVDLHGAEHIVVASRTLVVVVVNQPCREAVLVCYRHPSVRFIALPQG